MQYAALIPCGPADQEGERVADLLEALACYDPDACVIALVLNDGNRLVGDRIAGYHKCRVVDHPRNGEGWGWGGGLVGGELWSSELIAREYPEVGCIVKMDTDALPIKPLGAELGRIFADPSVGMAGSRIASNQLPAYKNTKPLSYFANKVRRLRAPVSVWRMPRWHFRFAIRRSHRWIASLYDQAETNGYIEGELIEGGACAWSIRLVRALVEGGVTSRWRDFLDAPVSDDIIVTMLAYSGGFRAMDAPLFCIEPRALRYAPSALMQDPIAGVVHSLKGYKDSTEVEIRRAFKEGRERQSQLTRISSMISSGG